MISSSPTFSFIVCIFLIFFFVSFIKGCEAAHVDISSLPDLRDEVFSDGQTTINGSVAPLETFRFVNVVTTSNANAVEISVSLSNASSIIFENCKFLSGVKISVSMNVTTTDDDTSLFLNNNSNNNNNNSAISASIQFVNSQISCSKQNSCAGVNEQNMKFALLIYLLPINLVWSSSSTSSASVPSVIDLPITKIPELSISLLASSRVELVDENEFSDWNIPAVGALSIQTPSYSSYEIDRKKYQTTIFERAKVGLENASAIPTVKVYSSSSPSSSSSASSPSTVMNNNPPPHVSLSILQNSIINCYSAERPTPRSEFFYSPRIFACVSIAPSFASRHSDSFSSNFGWNSTILALNNFTRKTSFGYRASNDESATQGIRSNGNSFSDLKLFVKKLEISGSGTSVISQCLITAAETEVPTRCIGIMISHAVVDKVIISDSASLTTKSTGVTISLLISEIHGGALPWIREPQRDQQQGNENSTTTASSSTEIATATTMSTTTTKTTTTTPTTTTTTDTFVLPSKIRSLLPAILINNTFGSITQFSGPGIEDTSHLCFIMIDMNNLLVQNSEFIGRGESRFPRIVNVMFSLRADELSLTNLKIDLVNDGGGNYNPAIGLVYCWHTRNVTIDNVTYVGLGKDAITSFLCVFDLRNFWTFKVANGNLGATTLNTHDLPLIAMQRVHDGKEIVFKNFHYQVSSTKAGQAIYFDDERVTNVETVLVDGVNGNFKCDTTTNIFTWNATAHNVTFLTLRNLVTTMTNGLQATCFAATVMGYGVKHVLLENIKCNVDCVLGGGVALLVLRENPYNMNKTDSVLLRNIENVARATVAAGFFVAIPAVFIGHVRETYGYYALKSAVVPMLVATTPIVMQNITYVGTSMIGAALMSSSTKLMSVVVENGDFTVSTGKFFSPLEFPVKTEGAIDTLQIVHPASNTSSTSSSSGGCLDFGGESLDTREKLNKYINRAYVKNVVAKNCGDTRTASITPSQTFYIPYKRTRTETNVSRTRTSTKSRTATRSASLPFSGYDIAISPSIQALETIASMSGIAGGAGATSALEASRALALIALAQRCASFKKEGARGLSAEERRQGFVDAYFNSPLSFPSSLLPFMCIPPQRGNCVRGAIVADIIFLILVFVATMAYAKKILVQAVASMTSPTQKLSASIFEYARLPFFLGMAFAWRAGNWITRVFVLFGAPGLADADQFLAVVCVLLWTAMIAPTLWIFSKHVNSKKFSRKRLILPGDKDPEFEGADNDDDDDENNINDDDGEQELLSISSNGGNKYNNRNNNKYKTKDSPTSNSRSSSSTVKNKKYFHVRDQDQDQDQEIEDEEVDRGLSPVDDFFSPPRSKNSNNNNHNHNHNHHHNHHHYQNNRNSTKNDESTSRTTRTSTNTNQTKNNPSPDREEKLQQLQQFLLDEGQEEDEGEENFGIDSSNSNSSNNNNNNNNSRPRRRHRRRDDDAQKNRKGPSEHWLVEEAMVSFSSLTPEEEESFNFILRFMRRATIYLVTSSVGKFFVLGDRVWSSEKLNRLGKVEVAATANGKPGLELWRVGGLAIKYQGPFVLERVLERRRSRREFREIRDIRNACTFAETSVMDRLRTRRYHFLHLRVRITPYYTFISFFWTLCACAAQGIALANPENCDGSIYFILVVNILAFAFDLWLRPFLVPFRNLAVVSSSLFLAIGAATGVFGGGPGTELFELTNGFVYAALTLNCIVAVFQTLLKVSLFCCNGSVLLRRELLMKLQELLDEDLSAVELIRRAHLAARRGSGNAAHTIVAADDLVGVPALALL